LVFYSFPNILNQIAAGLDFLNPCGAISRYLAVYTDGDIYPCHCFVDETVRIVGVRSGASLNVKNSCSFPAKSRSAKKIAVARDYGETSSTNEF